MAEKKWQRVKEVEKEEELLEEERKRRREGEAADATKTYAVAAAVFIAVVLAALFLFKPPVATPPGQAVPTPAPTALIATPTKSIATPAAVVSTPTPKAATPAPTATAVVETAAFPADEAARWVWWKEKIDTLTKTTLGLVGARCVDTTKYNEYFYGCKKNTAGGVTEYSLSAQAHVTKNFNATYKLPAEKPAEEYAGRTMASYASGSHRALIATCFAGNGLVKFEFPAGQDVEKFKQYLVENCPA